MNADGILEAGTTVLDVRATVPNASPVFYNITGPEDTLIRGFNIDRETVSFLFRNIFYKRNISKKKKKSVVI